MPFVFVLVFGIIIKADAKVQRLAHNSVITLFKKDLDEAADEDGIDIQESEKKKKKPTENNRTKKTKKIVKGKRSLVSSLLDDTESDDSEEDNGMDVEEPIVADKIQHISSMSIEKERSLKSFIYSVRAATISYWLSAYVKRD